MVAIAQISGILGYMRLQYPSGSLPSWVLPVLVLGASIGSSHAQAPQRASQSERALLAGSYASERLWVWQKRLKLADWDITLKVSRASELKPKTLGNIHWDADLKTATIRVLDPADYDLPQDKMLQDIEFTVVHELIHLELASLPRSEASRRDEEFAVNRIADALLKLDRAPTSPELPLP
jgi:hypothetical protein